MRVANENKQKKKHEREHIPKGEGLEMRRN
jgi:hypothetical protein